MTNPTGPYPPGQVDPWLELELAGDPTHTGLGFLPAIGLVATGYQTAEESGILSKLGGVFKIGDTPDHDARQLDQWARGVAESGAGVCAAGQAARDVGADWHFGTHEGWSKGDPIQFDAQEVMEAVLWAPEGRPGDNPGTYQGLVTAVAQPTAQDGKGKATDFRPYMSSRERTARLALGVAHGRIDCGVGWQEEPAVVHLNELVRRYRARPPEAPSIVPDPFLRPQETYTPPSSAAPLEAGLGGGTGLLVGLLVAGAAVTMLGARR